MPRVSAEQVKLAKKIDLLTYLQINEPHELVKPKHGTGEYRTVTHGSLVISNGLWFWNRGQVGGKSAVDYLIRVRNMGFVDAVKTVMGVRGVVGYGAADYGAVNGDVTSCDAVDYSVIAARNGRGYDSSFVLPVEDSKPPLQSTPPPKKWAFHPPRPRHYSNKSMGY